MKEMDKKRKEQEIGYRRRRRRKGGRSVAACIMKKSSISECIVLFIPLLKIDDAHILSLVMIIVHTCYSFVKL